MLDSETEQMFHGSNMLFKGLTVLWVLSFISMISLSFSQDSLDVVEVEAEKVQGFSEYWQENREARIFSGKKNTVTSLKDIPNLQTNNYRQATSQTPGLLISEIPNESIASMTFRGLGDPHESFNVLLLQDGLPVAADMYGYPAHYYSPALPMVDQFQFIRGGAGLQYGPQPGGVVNYISTPLRKNQPLSGKAGLSYGSYNLLSTTNKIFGSKGDTSYAVEYHRRQGDGPQTTNSDFAADYLQLRSKTFKGKNTYRLSFNGYNSDHGNSGGFAKKEGENLNPYLDDQDQATKRYDRLRVSRAQLGLGFDSRIDDSSQLIVNVWGSTYRRYSKSQRGSGFGVTPNGSDADTNDIVTQTYYGYNGEIRYLKNYSEHTLTLGYLNYNLISPLVSERGAAKDSNHGEVRSRLDRATHTNSFFVENRFSYGKFLITPGVRVESIRQSIDERKKSIAGDLREEDRTVNVPLFGLGLSYQLTEESQFYANFSEAYKPVTYSETLPAIDNATVSEDVDPSKILNYEAGYRGQTEKINWDVSAFFLRYENKFGLVGTNFQNTGASTHKGVDLSGEMKFNSPFSLYGNVEFLDARYTWGPQKDQTPQYAPKTMSRAGVIYRKEADLKVSLMGVVVGRHYGNDNNGNGTDVGTKNDFEIPSYTVFDLTSDWTFKKNWLLSGGINNLLDKNYTSRVRTDGVAWALGRNLYLGATYQF